MIVMNNLSFKANLIVDEKLYKKLPEGTPEGYTENLVAGYKKFLDHDVIKRATEGDTIELYKVPYRPGFAVGIRYTTDKFEKPLESGIFTNKKMPTVTSGSLIHDTMIYLMIKAGLKNISSYKFQDKFIKALKILLNIDETPKE